MNTAINSITEDTLEASIHATLEKVCGYIAPTWPLDQMIAVNPFWQMRSKPIEEVSARLSVLANAKLQMPAEYYHKKYDEKRITDKDLFNANKILGYSYTVEQLKASLTYQHPLVHWHNISNLLDSQRPLHKMAWHDEIIHQISQFCAAHYQQLDPMLHKDESTDINNLYSHWLKVICADKGLSILMGEKNLNRYFSQLPTSAEALIAKAIETLDINNDCLALYGHALLLDINGWASWSAYLRWQGDLYEKPHNEMLQLLAIRMAWDLVVWQYTKDSDPTAFRLLEKQWEQEKHHIFEQLKTHKIAQEPLWVWAKAHELNYQKNLHNTLKQAQKTEIASPSLQAIFCIDVRSEVMRRALELQNNNIETYGFAGFFGLPIEYQPKASALKRPQLPGLLKPVMQASEVNNQPIELRKHQFNASWQQWSKSAPSSFSMVESTGWLYAFKLFKQTFLKNKETKPKPDHKNWTLTQNGQALSLEDKAALASTIISAIGITAFADNVLLVGHGSHTTNNLHAAGLNCGACGGQTGEVNVRVLAALLNESDVRSALKKQGTIIPESCQFIAAIHNTTTDNITTFDHDFKTDNQKEIENWLNKATKAAQKERLTNIDPTLVNKSEHDINNAYEQRANDWSQVRPEWGLANNAAFIVAPRSWTKNCHLQGRSFLHDYTWQHDKNFSLLELIMTAPMIVTNWINTQYNASVTDNEKYGSGNKLLHNAVGGNIGVFEGNGGDLRIGLAKQSLHNGEKWMHEPLRLSVYIAAPKDKILAVYHKHQMIKDLVDNRWLNILCWGDDESITRLYQGQWSPSL